MTAVSATAYVVLVCVLAAAVLVGGVFYVRFELRTRVQPPPSWAMWLGYAVVAGVVIFGAARVSYAVLDLPVGPPASTAADAR